MKKNIVLILASTLLLAGCAGGNGGNVESAPTKTSDATATEVATVAKKAMAAISETTGIGVEAKVAGGFEMNVSADMGNGKSIETKQKLSIEKLAANAGIVKVGSGETATLKGSAGLEGKVTGHAETPEITQTGEIKTTSRDLDASFSAKAYAMNDKLYLDGSNLAESINKIATFAGAETVLSTSNSYKGYIDFGEGFFSSILSYQAMLGDQTGILDGMTQEGAPEFIKFGKYSNGDFGAQIDLTEQVKSSIGETGAQGKFNKLVFTVDVLVNEKGLDGIYATAAVDFEMSSSGAKVTVTADAAASVKFTYGDAVKVETLSSTDGYELIEDGFEGLLG